MTARIPLPELPVAGCAAGGGGTFASRPRADISGVFEGGISFSGGRRASSSGTLPGRGITTGSGEGDPSLPVETPPEEPDGCTTVPWFSGRGADSKRFSKPYGTSAEGYPGTGSPVLTAGEFAASPGPERFTGRESGDGAI